MQVFGFGLFRLCPVKRVVTGPNGTVLGLTSLEFTILGLLIRSVGRVLERAELSHAIWARVHGTDPVLSVHISAIRRKLGAAHSGAEGYIRTVQGRGYQFCEPVIEVDEPETAAPQTRPAEQEDVVQPSARGRRVRTRTIVVIGVIVAVCVIFYSFRTRSIEITSVRRLTTDGRRKDGPLVFDGKYVYFKLNWPDDQHAKRVKLSDLSVETLDGIAPDGKVGGYCEPDRTFLIFTDPTGPLSLLPADTSTPSPLLAMDGLVAGEPSKDCKQVAYAGDHLFGIADADMKNTHHTMVRQQRSFRIPGGGLCPHWRPDGGLVRFCVINPVTATAELWQMQPSAGSQPVAVRNAPSGICYGTCTGNGRFYIAAGNSNKNTATDLWVFQDSLLHGAVARPTNIGGLVWRWPAADPYANRLFAVGRARRFE
ncbi:MAG: winged helix-turn-helix domain-containing protein, partial [Bryobacteraceae bacterium]